MHIHRAQSVQEHGCVAVRRRRRGGAYIVCDFVQCCRLLPSLAVLALLLLWLLRFVICHGCCCEGPAKGRQRSPRSDRSELIDGQCTGKHSLRQNCCATAMKGRQELVHLASHPAALGWCFGAVLGWCVPPLQHVLQDAGFSPHALRQHEPEKVLVLIERRDSGSNL
jgi:hypothetical protein